MVYVMTIYNIWRVHGYSHDIFTAAWMGFPPAYLVAFLADWFVVGNQAKTIAFKIIGKNPPAWKIVICVSTCMVGGMVVVMSLFGAVHSVGFSSQTLLVWLHNIPANFAVALPLQILVAGPLVRFIFRAAFPVGVIID